MDVVTIEAQPRKTGKGAARAVRRSGNVPCVVYGHGLEPLAFQVAEPQIKKIVFSPETKRIRIAIDGKSVDCILKDFVLHPVTDRPFHVDFQELRRGEKILVAVPLRYIGTPVGQTEDGGDTSVLVHEIEVTCLPQYIPTHIELDISHLRIGEALRVSDLDVPNVEFKWAPEKTLVTVLAPRIQAAEVEEAEVKAEEASEEEGE